MEEVNPNPLVDLRLEFQDGVQFWFRIDPPVSQSQMWMDLGRLLAKWGVVLDMRLQEERNA